MSSRVLLDAQLPPKLARLIQEAGYPASHTFDHLPRTADDADIVRLANSLPAALMTKDADFADFSGRRVLVTTLIWVRTGNMDTPTLWAIVAPNLRRIMSAVEAGERMIEVR